MAKTIKSLLRSLLLCCAVGVLGSCGGSGSALVDNGPANNNSGDIDPDAGNTGSSPLVVAVTHLNGDLQLDVAGTAQTLRSPGYIQLETDAEGELVTTILSSPAQQLCIFKSTESATASLVRGTVDQIECRDLLTLTGAILQAGGESPINNALVTVRGFDASGNEVLVESDTTGADGNYLLENILLDNFSRMTLTVEQSSYQLFSLPISHAPATLVLEKNYSLSPPTASQTFDPAVAQSMTLAGVEIQLPANSLERADGSLAQGQVRVSVTGIDPSFAPELLPGGYLSSNNDALESYGAASIRFFIGDEELAYVEGSAATIRFPVAVRAQETAPENGRVFYFNKATGLWAEAGVSSKSGSQFELSVDRSTVWGVFESYPTINISGCVRGLSGSVVADTLIITQGQEYIGRLLAYTNAGGYYSVRARANSQVFLYARSDVASQTFAVETAATNISRSSCLLVDPDTTTVTLTWGLNPRDIDTHLIGPTGDGGTFHIDYTQKTADVNGVTIYLDVDDVTSYGPEVLTIPRFTVAGTYSYYTHLYAGDSTMYDSPTRIALFTNRVEHIFFVDDPGTERCWHVFDLEVDDNMQPTVTERGEYVDTSFCRSP